MKSALQWPRSLEANLLSFHVTCATEVTREGWSGKAHGTGHLGQVF